MLIKESANTDGLYVAYREDDLSFQDSIVGIHCPDTESEKEQLRNLGAYLGDHWLAKLLWLYSGKAIGVREGVINMQDILALPYTVGPFAFSEVEKVLLEDIANYQIDFRKNGAKSKVLHPIADSTDKMLEDYAKWYRDVLNSVYKDFKSSNAVVGKDFIGMAFYLGDQPNTAMPKNPEEFEQKLVQILSYRQSHQLYIRRMLITYQENVIFVFKPNQKRYWTRSIAITDADGTFADLVAQGY